jgi:membrane protein DedA with SNARE-associated domain
VYAVIAAFAAAENVFPPIPADSAVAIGAFLSVGGHVTAWGVFLVTWVANTGSAALVYVAARTVGRRFFRGPLGRRLLNRDALARIERLYERHGTVAIFASRFVPGVRAVVPPFAGVAGLAPVRALAPVAVASALWYGALTLAAATLVQNLDEVRSLVASLGRGALLLVAALLGLVVFLAVRRRRRVASGG